MNKQKITTQGNSFSNGVRVAFGISGIVALVLGLLILIAPMKTASIITAIVALYALVSGVIYLGIGIFSRTQSTPKRILNCVLGAMFLAAGILAFTDLDNSTVLLASFVAIMIGIVWVAEGVVALTTLSRSPNRLVSGGYAVLCVIAGVLVLFGPFTFASILWLILGISLMVLGAIQALRAFSFKGNAVIIGQN